MMLFRIAAFAVLLCAMFAFSFHAHLYDWANNNLWATVPLVLLVLIAVERLFPGIEEAAA